MFEDGILLSKPINLNLAFYWVTLIDIVVCTGWVWWNAVDMGSWGDVNC